MNNLNDPDIVERLKEKMRAVYNVDPLRVRIVRSPYRICPLGAHIDHQLGSVTAMALDQCVTLAYLPSELSEVCLQSLSFEGTVRFNLNNIPPKKNGDWGNYARGAAVALQEHAPLSKGILGITAGNLGAGGLSSSAAIGVAYLLALEDANGLKMPAGDNIELDRKIENGYLELKNGILDQSAILLSQRDALTRIDCKTATHEIYPKPAAMSPFTILVVFSGLSQSLVTTGYNQRVQECAEAAKVLLEAVGRPQKAPVLGNITPEEYDSFRSRLSGLAAKRAEHFFSESNRVRLGIRAWRQGNIEAFGQCMSESGKSSIDNYECGCEPLIDLYNILIKTEGVYGARFSGAGFRGCCVSLVDPELAPKARWQIQQAYSRRYPELAKNAPIIICNTGEGARIL